MTRRNLTEEERYQRYLKSKSRKSKSKLAKNSKVVSDKIKSKKSSNSELNEDLLKKLVSERKKRLELIRAKEERKKLNLKEQSSELKTENKEVEEENEFNVKEERYQKKLNKEEIEERKRKAQEIKNSKSARDITKEKIQELEKQISTTKYNKKTQHAIGLMKAQVAALKQKLSAGKGSGGGANQGYSVRRSGDATAVLLGFPSAGKSTLLNKLTGQESEVGAYAFTTLTCIPGMLDHKHAKIQILDVPGIVEGAASGSGRGREVLQVIRNADLVILLIDGQKPQHKRKIEKEVWEANIRVNKIKPDIKITKKTKDGIGVGRTVLTPNLDDDTVKSILRQFRIMNADVLIRDDINADDFIDAIQKNKVYLPAITVVSKADLIHPDDKPEIDKNIKPNMYVSAHENYNMEELKNLIFDSLKFIRVYLKEVNNQADMEVPMIMREGDTLKDLCLKLHKDFVDKFTFARIWGPSAKFEGQKLMKLSHSLKDGDIVEIHLK